MKKLGLGMMAAAGLAAMAGMGVMAGLGGGVPPSDELRLVSPAKPAPKAPEQTNRAMIAQQQRTDTRRERWLRLRASLRFAKDGQHRKPGDRAHKRWKRARRA